MTLATSHGVCLFDKPFGITSNAFLQKVRRTLGVKKSGFIGTLDPFATGLLPVTIGKATRIEQYIHEQKKSYTAILKLGTQTNTGDVFGEPIKVEKSIPILSPSQIEKACQAFLGCIEQTPPMYSAIKINGQRLYSMAKRGIIIDRRERKVTIHTLCASLMDEGLIRIDVSCSKGTYIRTLAEDLARYLGTIGHLIFLRRIEAGGWKLCSTSELTEKPSPYKIVRENGFQCSFLTIDQALPHFRQTSLSKKQAQKFSDGNPVLINPNKSLTETKPENSVTKVYFQREAKKIELIGLGNFNQRSSLLSPKKIFFPIS